MCLLVQVFYFSSFFSVCGKFLPWFRVFNRCVVVFAFIADWRANIHFLVTLQLTKEKTTTTKNVTLLLLFWGNWRSPSWDELSTAIPALKPQQQKQTLEDPQQRGARERPRKSCTVFICLWSLTLFQLVCGLLCFRCVFHFAIRSLSINIFGQPTDCSIIHKCTHPHTDK